MVLDNVVPENHADGDWGIVLMGLVGASLLFLPAEWREQKMKCNCGEFACLVNR